MMLAAFAGLFLVSCKKDYTCECTTSSTAAGFTSQTASAQTGKMKKADAEKKCEDGNKTYQLPNVSGGMDNYTIACELK